MSSAIARAALASVNNTAAIGSYASSSSRYETKSQETYGKSKVGEYAKRNIAAKSYDYDSSDDDDDDGERYSIDPSVELWKSMDFGGKKSVAPGRGAVRSVGAHPSKSSSASSSVESDFDAISGTRPQPTTSRNNNNNNGSSATTTSGIGGAALYQTPTKSANLAATPSSSGAPSGSGASRGPRPRGGPADSTSSATPTKTNQYDDDDGGYGGSRGDRGIGSVHRDRDRDRDRDSGYVPSYGGSEGTTASLRRNGAGPPATATATATPPAMSMPPSSSSEAPGGYAPSFGAFGARAGRIVPQNQHQGGGGGGEGGSERTAAATASPMVDKRVVSPATTAAADEPWDSWDENSKSPVKQPQAGGKGGKGGKDGLAEADETKDRSSTPVVAPASVPASASGAAPVHRVQSTGKDELRAMMEALRREKEEMARQLERAESERAAAAALALQAQSAVAETVSSHVEVAQRERTRLQAALEAMETQNRALAQQVETQQAQAAEAVEKERFERDRAVQQVTAQNHLLSAQVLEMQSKAERELAAERDALRHAVKRMEAEKLELIHRVQVTEEEALDKAQLLENQRREFQGNLRSLELEKDSLARKVEANETQAAQASAAVAAQLSREREALCERIGRMEAEKRALADSLSQTEARAQAQATALSAQLEFEKNALLENVQRMEQEKKEMADRLVETERHAQQRASEIAAQLQAERDNVQMALKAVEDEKLALAQRLAQNERVGQETGAVTEALQQEREALHRRLADMAREKRELTEKLRGTESLAQQREASMAEALAKEREELLLTVQRMKAERAEEKREAEALAEAAAKDSAEAAAAFAMSATAGRTAAEGGVLVPAHLLPMPHSPGPAQNSPLLTAKHSLKELLGQECQQGASISGGHAASKGLSRVPSHLRKEHMVVRSIDVIPEVDESRGDEGGGRSRKLAKKSSGVTVTGIVSESSSPLPRTGMPLPAALPDLSSSPHSETAAQPILAVVGAAAREDNDGRAAQEELERASHHSDDRDASSVNSFTDADLDDTMVATHEYDEEDDADADPFESLPAPHAAAARGDLARLKVLESLEPSLLTSFDEARRSPLFYAVAYAQEEVADYLLAIAPDLSMAIDAHGDTPMHAATSAGAAGCLERLIVAAFGEADPLNAMQMSPAHLARNVECLEVLFRYGADLAAVDVNGRSPLFVACAMNREACAEYLIGCLDESETSLLITDKRGDTPLHAAACNGAVDCLLMLLQYGIDPRSTNAVGLKAVDLAIRNKQKKCRELLAEYHLHYCTSSDFDSVLFLKTLEGHRSVKKYELAMKGQLGGGSGHSLTSTGSGGSGSGLPRRGSHNRSFTSGGGSGGLARPRSIFSMKNASVRLQRWGSWLSYEDPHTKKEYWYNHRTGAGQFEKPDKVRELQIKAVTLGQDSLGYEESQAALNMKIKRKGDWIEYLTEEGKTFYYNEKNGDFSWVEPKFGRAFRAAITPAAEITSSSTTTTTIGNGSLQPQPQSQSQSQSQSHTPASDNSSSAAHTCIDASLRLSNHQAVSEDTEGVEGVDSPEGVFTVDPENVVHNADWKPYNDPATGFVFWYNSATKMSQWECPSEVTEDALQQDSAQPFTSQAFTDDYYAENDAKHATHAHDDHADALAHAADDETAFASHHSPGGNGEGDVVGGCEGYQCPSDGGPVSGLGRKDRERDRAHHRKHHQRRHDRGDEKQGLDGAGDGDGDEPVAGGGGASAGPDADPYASAAGGGPAPAVVDASVPSEKSGKRDTRRSKKRDRDQKRRPNGEDDGDEGGN